MAGWVSKGLQLCQAGRAGCSWKLRGLEEEGRRREDESLRAEQAGTGGPPGAAESERIQLNLGRG